VDVAAILSELDDYGFEDLSTTIKVGKIQAAIWDIEKLRPWPFLEESILLDFDGTSSIPTNFPADFRASIRLRDLVLDQRITPKRLDDAEEAMGTDFDLVGDPLFYYFEGGKLKLWRVPAAASDRMKLRYIQWSDEITDTTTESGILIPKYFHRSTILPKTLQYLYDMTDDPELASRFEGQFKEGLMEMIEACFVQQYDQADYVHVVDPDDWDYLGL
jgi:hypothetical protein